VTDRRITARLVPPERHDEPPRDPFGAFIAMLLLALATLAAWLAQRGEEP
jgi:hypothetical protein